MTEEQWIYHIRRLAKDKADLSVEVRSLRLEVTRLKDEVLHYQQEFSRQNARIIELSLGIGVK